MRYAGVALLAALVLLGCGDGGLKGAEESVRYTMLDPDAAQFRDVRRCPFNEMVVQGEVNGKNRFGAYVGFEPFIYYDGRVAIGYEDPNWDDLFLECTRSLPRDESGNIIVEDDVAD